MSKYPYLLISLLFIVALTACSYGRVSEQKNGEDTVMLENRAVVTPLSEWLVEIPQSGIWTIGISRASRNWSDMYSPAREMATVQYARNLSSFNIDNFIMVERLFGDTLREDKRSLIFQVSDANQLWRIYDSLELQEYYILHNSYLLALFELKEGVSSDDSVCYEREVTPTLNLDSSAPDKPTWYEKDELIVGSDHVYSHKSASSACLIDAWNIASQQARLALAAYFSTAVESVYESRILTESEQQKRAIALETLYNLRDIELNRSYLTSSFRENSIRYKVYIEMKIKMD